MKKAFLAVMLVAAFASVSCAAANKAQIDAMSLFLSNFTELGYMDFDSDEIFDDAEAAVRFGARHNYVNSFKSKIVPCKVRNCPHGSLTIDKKFVSESLEKYFGRKFTEHQTVDEYFYDGKLYHFEGADGEATYYARVKNISGPTRGMYRATGDIYNVDDKSDIPATFTAEFGSHTWGGKATYYIVSFATEYK